MSEPAVDAPQVSEGQRELDALESARSGSAFEAMLDSGVEEHQRLADLAEGVEREPEPAELPDPLEAPLTPDEQALFERHGITVGEAAALLRERPELGDRLGAGLEHNVALLAEIRDGQRAAAERDDTAADLRDAYQDQLLWEARDRFNRAAENGDDLALQQAVDMVAENAPDRLPAMVAEWAVVDPLAAQRYAARKVVEHGEQEQFRAALAERAELQRQREAQEQQRQARERLEALVNERAEETAARILRDPDVENLRPLMGQLARTAQEQYGGVQTPDEAEIRMVASYEQASDLTHLHDQAEFVLPFLEAEHRERQLRLEAGDPGYEWQRFDPDAAVAQWVAEKMRAKPLGRVTRERRAELAGEDPNAPVRFSRMLGQMDVALERQEAGLRSVDETDAMYASAKAANEKQGHRRRLR